MPWRRCSKRQGKDASLAAPVSGLSRDDCKSPLLPQSRRAHPYIRRQRAFAVSVHFHGNARGLVGEADVVMALDCRRVHC
jgi:hypothetical protein